MGCPGDDLGAFPTCAPCPVCPVCPVCPTLPPPAPEVSTSPLPRLVEAVVQQQKGQSVTNKALDTVPKNHDPCPLSFQVTENTAKTEKLGRIDC